MNQDSFRKALAVIAESEGKTASHLRDADSLQTRAKFRYERAISRQQQNMDRLRAKSLNDILADMGEHSHIYLHPDNPMRDQLLAVSRGLNRSK